MDDSSPERVGGEVRSEHGRSVSFAAIRRRYEQCPDENALQERLAAELTAQGWRVWREVEFQVADVYCLIGGKGLRRADLYCTAPPGLDRLQEGEAVAIELKFEVGESGAAWKVGRELRRQILGAVSGHDWRASPADGGAPLVRPSWVLGGFREQLMGAPLSEWQEGFDRDLWCNGAALLRRQGLNLVATRHIVRRDCGVYLTRWSFDTDGQAP